MTAPRKRAPAKRTSRAAAPRQSQRERLRGRQRPSMPYRLLVDADDVAAAREALAKAQREARQVLQRDTSTQAQRKYAEKTVAETEAAVDACYETITLRALPPPRWEELEAAHPATPEQMARAREQRQAAQQRGEDPPEWPAYDDAEFWPAALAEVADGDMTVEDWRAFLAENVSTGEAAGLKRAVLQVQAQERVADPLVLPKGLTEILSSRSS